MRILKRKEKGILDDILPVIVFIMVLAVMLSAFINYNKAVNQKTTINIVAREYLLKMETTGYLTNSIRNDLSEKLTELGYRGDTNGSEISASNFTGSTTNAVGYGNKIVLTFKVYTRNEIISDTVSGDTGTEGFNLFMPKIVPSKYVPITITYEGTSKE